MTNQDKLKILQEAAASPDGMFREGAPCRRPIHKELAKPGLLEYVDGDSFCGIDWRITDKGRAYVKAREIPAWW